MNMFSKWFLEKEIIAILSDIDAEFNDYSIYGTIKYHAEKRILKNRKEIIHRMRRDNRSPRMAAYAWINNVSGDMVASGLYHIYRGTLCMTGKELLKIFDVSTDQLVEDGEMTKDRGEQQKVGIRESINSIG
jgi:hypothetical protein